MESMNKKTLKLALPSIAEMMMQTLLGIADTAMVGSLGGIAIAAISFTDAPMMVMLSFFAAISVGTTALVARFVGAKNFADAEETIKQSLIISVLSSVVFTLLMMAISKQVVSWMGAEPDVIPHAEEYLRFVLLGLPGLILTMIMSGALRGAGDTKSPMLVNGLSNIINIVGNFLLIFPTRQIVLGLPFIERQWTFIMWGAGWGVAGAAIATSLSRWIAAILILKLIFGKKGKYHIRIDKKLTFHREILSKILKVGLPAAGEQLVFRLAQLTFFRIVASLGTVMVAAHRITMTSESISFMPGWGFALASTTLVGQYLGANDPEKAKEGGYTAAKMAMAVMIFFGILFFFFPRIFIRIFTTEEPIIEQAVICLRIVAISQPFLAMTMVFAGGLRGAGDTKTVLRITGIGSWVIRVGGGYFLAIVLGIGLAGAWTAMTIDFMVRGTTYYYIFKKGKWQDIEI